MIEYIPVIVILIGSIGILRLPEFFSRLQAQTLIAVNVCIFILIYGFLQGYVLYTILIVCFIAITSPVAAHAIAKTGYKKLFKRGKNV